MEGMTELLELQQILASQCAVQDKLLVLEEEKTQVLLKGDPQALFPILHAQQALLVQSKDMEKQRVELSRDTPYPTLRELVKSSRESEDMLGPVFKELQAKVMALKKKCGLNRKLLETRLATLRFMSGQIGLDGTQNTYTKNVRAKV